MFMNLANLKGESSRSISDEFTTEKHVCQVHHLPSIIMMRSQQYFFHFILRQLYPLYNFRNTSIYLFFSSKDRYVLLCIGVRMLDSWSELGGVRTICGATLPSASARSTPVSSDLANPTALLTMHFLKWVLMLLLCENLPPQLEQAYGLVPVW